MDEVMYLDLDAMPNPFSRIVPNAEIYLDPNVLDSKSEMAPLVAKIFALWASIERELKFLLVRVLGADAGPAIAIYETLTAQHLQLSALDAAAKVALSERSYDVFLAVTAIAKGAQAPRNDLAHLVWGDVAKNLSFWRL
jgi:hypothetical protein